MKLEELWQSLAQSPKMAWNLLLRARYDSTYDLMPVHLCQIPLAKRLNLLKSGINFIYRRLFPWNWPVHMQIELTNYCNLKCPVCPTGIRENKRRPMAMDVVLFERLMNEVGPYLLTVSLFAWGEPLLHPRLAEILRIARRHDVVTILSTNGQNLDDENILNAIIRHPPTYLIVAIDGLTNETNSMFRVGAKLDTVLKGVHHLAEMKRQKGLNLPVLHMRYMVMKHNQHELSRLQDFATMNMFDLLTIRTLSIIDAPERIHREFLPDAEEYRAYRYKGDKRLRRTDFICQHAFSFPTVFTDGTVVACDQDYNAQQPYGSLTNDVSFADVWFSKQAAEVRRTIRDNRESFSFCRNCPYADRPINTCSIRVYDLRGRHQDSFSFPKLNT